MMSNMEAIFKHCKALGVGWTQRFTKLALPNLGQHGVRSYKKETKAYTTRQNTWYCPSPHSIRFSVVLNASMQTLTILPP